jgi:Leucine-rich repeat (LRR) protein
MSAESAPRRSRKLLRVSMRTLVVVVLLIGGGMGWLVRSARIQHAAVSAVLSVGGSVMYDWEWNKRKGYTGSSKSWVPKWASDRIGIDYFDHVTSIWLYYTTTDTDTTLIPVARLTQLEWLSLYGSSVTDSGLQKLKGLTNLARLDLDYAEVSDSSYANLSGLTGLSVLSLNGTRITDNGLAHLKGLTNLTELNLAGTHVTDAGLLHLKGLRNLAILNIVNTRITDAGVIELMQARPGLRIYR